MRNTPTTLAFFEDELLPLFEDCICSLLDEDPDMDVGIIHYHVDEAKKTVSMDVRLPRKDAGRVVGREHRMRQSLYTLYSAICRNHGFNLVKFTVSGTTQ